MKRKKKQKLSHNGDEDENDGRAEVALKQQTKKNDDTIDSSKNSSTQEPSRKRKKKKKSKKHKMPKDTDGSSKNSPTEEVAPESRPTKKQKGNNDCDDESSKNSSKREKPAETSRPVKKKRKKKKKKKKQQKDEADIPNTTTVEDCKTNTTNSATDDNQKQGKVSSSSLPISESAVEFPYEVDPDDHCESPLAAYEDILPLLHSYRRRKNQQSAAPGNNTQLSIYDPYFCNGRVAFQLKSMGFPDVYNRKEDCYKVWQNPSIYPNYDVFLTNPPYSGDHIEKLMTHVTGKQNEGKPWMLLMPNFVHKKDYFQRLTSNSGQLPIYLVPKKRYVYLPPPNMRDKKASSTHKKSSPFVSMWYLWGGSREVTNDWYNLLRKQRSTAFDVARSKSALRDLRRKHK